MSRASIHQDGNFTEAVAPGEPLNAPLADGASQAANASTDFVAGASIDFADLLRDEPTGRVDRAGTGGATVFASRLSAYVHRVIRADHADARRQLRLLLTSLIAQIDTAAGTLLDEVLHHARFRQLEGSWRALRWLASKVEPESKVRIRVFNASRHAVIRDVSNALEFDQSHLFHQIYENEFGTPGGSPYGVIVADLEFDASPASIDLMRRLSHIGAAAFAPIVGGISPMMFGLTDFGEMERLSDLRRIVDRPEYAEWRAFRKDPASRFFGLTLPRMLIRAPYTDDGAHASRFRYEERQSAEGSDDGVWASAAWGLAANVIRSFAATRWPADIRGIRRITPTQVRSGSLSTASMAAMRPSSAALIEDAGGVLVMPASVAMGLESAGVSRALALDAVIPELQHDELVDLGFIPLSICKETELCCFHSCWSVHDTGRGGDRVAGRNARVSSILQHVLCAARFAHYLKVLARDRIGSVQTADELETLLRDWIRKWSVDGSVTDERARAEHPLADYRIKVTDGALPGTFDCELMLQPHFQLETLSGGITLATVLRGP